MDKIVIDPEFQALIPPLGAEEFQQLEENIRQGGCRDPLVTWGDTLIDGHNRYEICTRLGLKFKTVALEFADRDAVKVWMIDNQTGKRNISDGWKFELKLIKKSLLASKGKAKYEATVGRPSKKKSLSTIDNDKHNTQQELAKDLGWSTGKVAMADKVWKDAKPEVKEKVKSGDVSINQAYQEIRKEEKKAKQEESLHARSDDKSRKTAKLKKSLYDVRRGDFREVLQDIEAVSLILTDPPYPKDSLGLWSDLGKWAANALADDGMLVAYSGQMYLPQVLNNLSEHLDYWWCGAVVHKGSGNLTPLGYPVRKVINQWKPLVMFYKKGGVGFQRTFRDLLNGVGPEKTDHNWQQPVEEAKALIEAFTIAGELVVDPFAGSGGFCRAAHEAGRISIGAEILSDE
jgi:ParB-like chromosome segregation protein Spo0J